MIEVEDILGCATETVHISSHHHPHHPSTDDLQMMDVGLIDVVMVPGNPGTIAFYLDFMSALAAVFQDAFPSDLVRVHGLSHANHHLRPVRGANSSSSSSSSSSTSSLQLCDDDTCPSYGLEFQNLHSLEFICRVLRGCYDSHIPASGNINSSGSSSSNKSDLDDTNKSSPAVLKIKGRRRLFLIGHSIGAYIILDCITRLNQRGDSLIKRHLAGVVNLMPFIFWRNIPALHKLSLRSFIWTAPLSSGLVKSAISALASRSSPSRRWILNLFQGGQQDETVTDVISERMVCRRFAENFLSMGMGEIAAVPENETRMLQALLDLQSSCVPLCFLYTDNDVWAPDEDLRRILQPKFSGSRSSSMYYVPGITHAFTLHPGGSEAVLGRLADFLVKLAMRSKL